MRALKRHRWKHQLRWVDSPISGTCTFHLPAGKEPARRRFIGGLCADDVGGGFYNAITWELLVLRCLAVIALQVGLFAWTVVGTADRYCIHAII